MGPPRVDDQDPIQPGDVFKHMVRAPRISQTEPFQRIDVTTQETFVHPPSGGVSTPSIGNLRTRNLQPSSPSAGVANVGVRRSERSLILLSSPARPGHSTRMRHLFESASSGNAGMPCDGTVSYPKLPNISRAFSPAPSYRSDQYALQKGSSSSTSSSTSSRSEESFRSEFRQSYIQPVLKSSSSESTRSCSTDWTLLAAEGAERAVSPSYDTAKSHVTDWLSTITPDDQFGQRMTSPPRPYHDRTEDEDCHTNHHILVEDECFHPPHSLRGDDQDPCHTMKGVSRIDHAFENSHIDLSPLSPKYASSVALAAGKLCEGTRVLFLTTTRPQEDH